MSWKKLFFAALFFFLTATVVLLTVDITPSIQLEEFTSMARPGVTIDLDAGLTEKKYDKRVEFTWTQTDGAAVDSINDGGRKGSKFSFTVPPKDLINSSNNQLKILLTAKFEGYVVESKREIFIDIACPGWNSDCDKIFDNIEADKVNQQTHKFRVDNYDDDPSKSYGFINRGCLKGAVNLPDQGAGYYQLNGSDPDDLLYHENRDDWGTVKTLSCIEKVGRKVAENKLCMDGSSIVNCVGINDISLRDGGIFGTYLTRKKMRESFHDGHQIGTEFDVRYLRTDLAQSRVSLVDETRHFYDKDLTAQLIKLFITECEIEQIIVDPGAGIPKDFPKDLVASGGERLITHDTRTRKHANHFHVRVKSESQSVEQCL